ncbi:uncharacterized protein LOC143540163 [Bidens hawaiensis]|uniref:uncharacterized protein LOC143540163 n=1 Tax=Bidens hawaiensis TaxID=980011 RepID=UPI0040499483
MTTLQEPQFDLESGHGGGDTTIRQPALSNGSEKSISITTEITGLVLEELVMDLGSCNSSGGGEESKNCRICYLSWDANIEESENGIPIELGCCCKDDLAAAHKHCAEAWFKIKGNRTCEICGSIAQNIAGVDEAEILDRWSELPNGSTPSQATAPGATEATSEARNFCQGHWFLNFLLGSILFAFVISWLFHYDIPS